MSVVESDCIDMLVAGAGMAGVFAALAAAKDGLKVALVEPSNVLGGQGTSGGVAGFCGDYTKVNEPFQRLIDHLEIMQRIAPLGLTNDRRDYDLEYCGFAIQEMVRKAGIDVYMHSQVIAADQQDQQITTTQIAMRGGVVTLKPRMVIDATGSCVLARLAGFPVIHLGANEQLPMSLYFTMWDTGKPVKPILPAGCPTWETDENLPMTTLHRFDTGKIEVKMKVVGFDAADGRSFSEAEMHARLQMMGLIYYLQTRGYNGQVLDRHVLASVSRQIGVREACRIQGEHFLTEDQVMNEAVFDDAVAVGTYHLDYHWPDRVQRAGTGITTMVRPYHIPLRSMIPKGARNLLVPGRGASGDQMAMSSFRVMATCAQMGYAAGKAASLACASDCDVTAVPIQQLQDELERDGQALDLSRYGAYLHNRLAQHETVIDDVPPFDECHASTLVQLKNSRFLCAFFAGSKEGRDDVRIWFCYRYQGRWSKPLALPAVGDLPHWNPVFFADKQGVVHLFFKVGKKISSWQTWRMISYDQGQSWSKPQLLVDDGSHSRGPVKNKPIRLSNGDWLAPSSVEFEGRDSESWQVFCDRSTDDGHTWQAGDCLTMQKDCQIGLGAIQPTLWESDPGHVHMLTRSTAGRILRSDSTDYGRTWCPLYATDIPNNNSGIDLAKLDDGSLALVFNPIACVSNTFADRSRLAIALSLDNGRTWDKGLMLENSEGEFSYPAIIPTRVGMAVTYTSRRKTIGFWHGSIAHLSEQFVMPVCEAMV